MYTHGLTSCNAPQPTPGSAHKTLPTTSYGRISRGYRPAKALAVREIPGFRHGGGVGNAHGLGGSGPGACDGTEPTGRDGRSLSGWTSESACLPDFGVHGPLGGAAALTAEGGRGAIAELERDVLRPCRGVPLGAAPRVRSVAPMFSRTSLRWPATPRSGVPARTARHGQARTGGRPDGAAVPPSRQPNLLQPVTSPSERVLPGSECSTCRS